MINTLEIPNLPSGFGNVLGIFIRNSYLTCSSAYRIIGVSFKDTHIFNNIAGSTVTVVDIGIALSQKDIDISQSGVSGNCIRFETLSKGFYKVTYSVESDTLTSDDLAPAIVFKEKTDILKTANTGNKVLEFTLYIKKISGVMSEEMSMSLILENDGNTGNVFSMAVSGVPDYAPTYTVVENGQTESLLLHYDTDKLNLETLKSTIDFASRTAFSIKSNLSKI